MPAATIAARPPGLPRRALTALTVGALALVMWLIAGVGFANYDTLYALAWGNQLANGETPAYGVAIAPTPHPLVELLGLVLSPLPVHLLIAVTVALAFLALAGCGWALYRLGASWFNRGAGLVAAALFLTRVPVLSYGVRAYIDVPYVLLVLSALLVETRRPRAGAPVLGLLALAGLLRPEAWVLSALYWLYALDLLPTRLRARLPPATGQRTRAQVLTLTALAAAGPVIWIFSDLAITGRPLWSLTNTRHTASTLDRATGIAKVPKYVPKRIGEILQVPGLAAALVGGVLSLAWLRGRAIVGAIAGVLAVAVFIAFAVVGLPIDTRYAFLAAAILSIFAGAGVCGWWEMARAGGRRRLWLAGAIVSVALFAAYAPSQYRTARKELHTLSNQQRIEGDLVALVRRHAINLRCGPVGVPNHAPIPLLALYLNTSPANVVSPESGHISSGIYVDPASRFVEKEYILDEHDPHEKAEIPPGFAESALNSSWLIFSHC